MEKKFTKNDVLRYLYNEMGASEEQLFMDALLADEVLWQEFELLKESQEMLGESVAEPSPETMAKVRLALRKAARKTRSGKTATARLFSLPLVLAVTTVLFCAGASLFGLYHYQKVSGEQVVQASQPRLRWDDPALEQRIQNVRFNINNMSDERNIPVPLIHNTWRLINVNQPSPCGQNVVLLNLR